MSQTQNAIIEQCDFIADLLLDKNRRYGDSALNPLRLFSSADAIEQLNVRIDDKLSRIASAQDDDAEDAELDLIGYLVLKRIAVRARRTAKPAGPLPSEQYCDDDPAPVVGSLISMLRGT